jgi:diacylglycerol kinase (ATP)
MADSRKPTDVAMIEQTNERTKARLGWVAYIGGTVRALKGSPSAQFQIRIDGAAAVHYRAVGVLVSDVARLQPA